MLARLILEDGTEIEGKSFGYEGSVTGEVVFSTGMVGYPESLTDPSYEGQIMVCTYPLIGNYGVSAKHYWEAGKIHATGLIVSNYIDSPSHCLNEKTLGEWLIEQKVPGIEIKDTRALTLKLREKGVMLGKIVFGKKDLPIVDPNLENLVAKVSRKDVLELLPDNPTKNMKTIVVFDCGVKFNTPRHLLKRGVRILVVPWDYDIFENGTKCDGILVSNGPGDPKMATKTIEIIQKALANKVPTFGICLGNQLLALAAGGDTYKLKFGHRSQNQPCVMEGTNRCYLTTQNHGFAVGKIPKGFKAWFTNANDGTNEGIIHEKLPFMSVQFHPEAAAGPVDTEWLFDYFLEKIK